MAAQVPGGLIEQPEDTGSDGEITGAKIDGLRKRKGHGRWRALRWGCLGLLLFICSGVGMLVAALASGPVTLAMPGGTDLKLGSNDTVLSNFTFQDGTTYYFDMSGNGVRNILEVNYVKASRSLELVVHHATRQEQSEDHLLTVRLP